MAQSLFKKYVVAGIYGAGGENAGDNPLLKAIVEDQGGKMFTSLVGEGDSEVIEYLENGYDEEKNIKIYGYSRGGNAAIRIANTLGEMGIVVDQLYTFDPHSLNQSSFTLKHGNVVNAYNYYQRNPRTGYGISSLGTNPFWGSPVNGSVQNLLNNVNYTGNTHVNHLNIVELVTLINKILILLSIFFIGCSDINLFHNDTNNIILNVKAVERYTYNPRTKDSIEVRIVKKPLLRHWQKIFLLRQKVDSLGMISFFAKKKRKLCNLGIWRK